MSPKYYGQKMKLEMRGEVILNLLVYDSDVALQIQEEHPLAVRSQAGDHPEPALGLVDPDVLRDILFFTR